MPRRAADLACRRGNGFASVDLCQGRRFANRLQNYRNAEGSQGTLRRGRRCRGGFSIIGSAWPRCPDNKNQRGTGDMRGFPSKCRWGMDSDEGHYDFHPRRLLEPDQSRRVQLPTSNPGSVQCGYCVPIGSIVRSETLIFVVRISAISMLLRRFGRTHAPALNTDRNFTRTSLPVHRGGRQTADYLRRLDEGDAAESDAGGSRVQNLADAGPFELSARS